MAVLLANRSLGLRRRPKVTTDEHGEDVLGPGTDTVGPWPGRARERSDGNWSIGLDPQAHPVRDLDVVFDADSGEEWLVTSAELIVNNADDAVNYYRIDGRTHYAESQTESPGAPER